MLLSNHRIGVIANPRAGLARRRLEAEALKGYLPPETLWVWTENVEHLRQTLTQYKVQGIDLLIILGGDGTLRLTLQIALEIWTPAQLPWILPLPGGTMNVIPASIGLTGDPGRLLKTIAAGARLFTTELPLLRLGSEVGFIFGSGSFVRFLQHYYQKHPPTPQYGFWLLCRLAASLMVNGHLARQVFSSQTYQIQVDDGAAHEYPLHLLSLSTVRHIGFGFHPYFLAQRPPLIGHLLQLKPPALTTLYQLPNLFLGRDSRLDGTHTPCHRLSVNSITPSSPSMLYAFDGEILSTTLPCHIEITAKIRLLTLRRLPS